MTKTTPAIPLPPHPENPRKISPKQLQALEKSVHEFGDLGGIVFNTRTKRTVSGHQRVKTFDPDKIKPVITHSFSKATRTGTVAIGYIEHSGERFSYREVDWDEQREKAAMIAANKHGGDWDNEKLRELITTLTDTKLDIELLGFDQAEITKLLGVAAAADTQDDNDSVTEQKLKALQKKWKVQPGDVWQIGPHRIVCGDSTRKETYDKLLHFGETVGLYYTDPPYGVSYKAKGKKEIANDDLQRDALANFLIPALRFAFTHLRPDGSGYIWHASSTRRDFEHALDAVGFREKQYITWVKEAFVLGHADYHWQTEPCFYVEKSNGAAKFYGDRAQSTVWRIAEHFGSTVHVAIVNGLLLTNGDGGQLFIKRQAPKGKFRHVRVPAGKSVVIAEGGQTDSWEVSRDNGEDYLHPTQKPVPLAERAILNSSRPGDTVLDNFHGSGATMVACEKHKRFCRAVELDPRYVAVALERMTEMGCQPDRGK